MKSFLFLFTIPLFFLISHNSAPAQVLEPVKWEVSAEKTGENEYMLVFKATIEEEWKIFAKDVDHSTGKAFLMQTSRKCRSGQLPRNRLHSMRS